MTVLLPDTLEEAIAMLEHYGGDAVPMAGGTDLLVLWPMRVDMHDKLYMDISQLRELRQIIVMLWGPTMLGVLATIVAVVVRT